MQFLFVVLGTTVENGFYRAQQQLLTITPNWSSTTTTYRGKDKRDKHESTKQIEIMKGCDNHNTGKSKVKQGKTFPR
jgi:hypothetical protein